jgi:hypothetical protein
MLQWRLIRADHRIRKLLHLNLKLTRRGGGSISTAGVLAPQSKGGAMADEPEKPASTNPASENRALAMLLRLEARVEGLADELQRVKGRLAYVESRLARIETEYNSFVASDARVERDGNMSLDIAEIAPPLLPGEDQEALAEVARQIKARRTRVHVLSDDERTALDAAWRSGIVSREEMAAFWKRRLG